MICPRCGNSKVEIMAESKIKNIWIVYQCLICLYTWRNTEPSRRTKRDDYPEEFRMTQKDIDNAPEVPTIPPLIKNNN